MFRKTLTMGGQQTLFSSSDSLKMMVRRIATYGVPLFQNLADAAEERSLEKKSGKATTFESGLVVRRRPGVLCGGGGRVPPPCPLARAVVVAAAVIVIVVAVGAVVGVVVAIGYLLPCLCNVLALQLLCCGCCHICVCVLR